MPKVAITKSKLDALAAKIATKSGETLPLTLDEMGDAVDDISGGGVDMPTFTVTWDNDYSNILSVSCDKTYDECRSYSAHDKAYAFVIETNGTEEFYTVALNTYFTEVFSIGFTVMYGVFAGFDIIYNSDGTFSIANPSDVNEVLNITQNGTYYPDPGMAITEVDVNVPSTVPNLQSKSNIAPTESSQTITADSGFDGLSSVQINAISSSYVGSGITRRSSTDLTASGATVTVPAGYYDAQASKAVASGTEGTPTATKGTVSNHAVTVTPSVTNTAGYIAGGTHSGTGVSVSASELVSGTLNVTSSGTKDVTNYASASIPAGTVTAPSSISGTSATVSTGTNTLTLTKTVSVTPNVTTAGYISSGTAGNSSISLQASVTTKAAATIHPSTSDQTIASGTYTTGAQTIKAVTHNLDASKILSGTTIKIGDSTDDDCVASVTGTYTGGSSKALYKYEGLASRTANSYGSTSATVTVTKAGTYDISYVAIRGSSSGTMGTNLHIGANSGTNNQTFNNGTYGQYATLTNQQIAANTTVTIYATSGSNSRTIYVGQLIVEEV